MDAAQALADLVEISSQIESAVLANGDGAVLASTLTSPERSEAIANEGRALLSGAVAVLIALVAHGPVTALIRLAVVIGVQQLESHVLQPVILGRSVRVHPLAVIAAIAAGAILAGIVGTLVAVPVVAVVKAVAEHLFRHDDNDGSEEVGGSPPVLDDAPVAAGESPRLTDG